MRSVRGVLSDSKSWWMIPLLALTSFVPVLGQLILLGYQMRIMHDVALGADSGIPAARGDGAFGNHAARGFWVTFVWGGAMTLPLFAILFLSPWSVPSLGAGSLSSTLIFLISAFVLGLLMNSFIQIPLLRAAVYGRAREGFVLRGLRDMVSRDWTGLGRVFLTVMALYLVTGVMGYAVYLSPTLIGLTGLTASLTSLVTLFLVQSITIVTQFVAAFAFGLWAQGTNPAGWPGVPLTPIENHRLQPSAIALGAVLIIGAVGTGALLLFSSTQVSTAQEQSCFSNMRVVVGSVGTMEAEVGAGPSEITELVPRYLRQVPLCPSDGTYEYDPETMDVTCSIHGHY